MSQYISSILIEPIIRQARRFSRPSNESEPPHASFRQISLGGNATSASQDAVAAVTIENPGPINLILDEDVEEDVEPLIHPIDSVESLSPGLEGEGLETGPQVWENRENELSPLRDTGHVPGFYDYARSRLLVSLADDETSDNPFYGVPDRFRSTLSNAPASMTDAGTISRESSNRSSRAAGRNAQGRSGSHNSRAGSEFLPADDGMGHVRRRILSIQNLSASNTTKARLIHEIMTERYTSLQSSLHAPHRPRSHSPSSSMSQDRPCTPSTHSTENIDQIVSSPISSFLAESMNPFHLTPEDLKPTYFSKRFDLSDGSESLRKNHQQSQPMEFGDGPRALGCPHYKRNIKLQCSACDRWYTCRFCHDEVEDHSLNRRETKNMLCMLCGLAQLASEECAHCGVPAARYYCGVCKLWDDDPKKSIYHCNDCGICRVGQGLGKDYYHCKVRARQDIFKKLIIQP